jgi:hypothetical protein
MTADETSTDGWIGNARDGEEMAASAIGVAVKINVSFFSMKFPFP